MMRGSRVLKELAPTVASMDTRADTLARLARTSDYVAQLEDLIKVEKKRRAGLVYDATELGCPGIDVARAARLSRARCSQLLAEHLTETEARFDPEPVPA